MTIYFLLAPEVKRVKIGYSGANFLLRIEHIESSSPVDLQMFGVIKEHPKDWASFERELHARFSTRRVRREWFNYDNSMLEEIRTLDNFIEGIPKELKPPRRHGKLTVEEVQGIDRLLKEKERTRPHGYLSAIAREYNTSIAAICHIRDGRSWTSVTGRKKVPMNRLITYV